MELCVPLTVDLTKDQVKAKGYGIEHINKLLEEELAQLRSLKSQNQAEILPVLKYQNDRFSEVEGLMDYHRRIQQTKTRAYKTRHADKQIDAKTNVEPFSEISYDYTKGKRITGKGEVPFFKVSADKHPLSYRLPKLLNSQPGKTMAISYTSNPLQTPLCGYQRNISRKIQRSKRSSVKLLKAHGKMKSDLSSDSSDDLTDSLTVQYCTMATRDSFEHDREEKSTRKTITRANKLERKTFHLACTREPVKYHPDVNGICSFCSTSLYIRERRHSHNFDRKSQRSSIRKIETAEKPFFPEIQTDVAAKPELGKKNQCEKCRKRLEQAEQNRINLITAGSVRKNELRNCVSRKVKTRYPTKEKLEQPPNKEVDKLPLVECTAYRHEDGSLFLLPGAFTLHNKDYNIWSRNVTKTTNQQKLLTNSNLPNIT